MRLGPNQSLLGQPQSLAKLQTPALILDLDAFERNLRKMAEFAAAAPIAIRPHTKTHKSVRIASLQQAAGAAGVCCTTLGEAEVMVAGGVRAVLITSPVVGAAKIARLMELLRSAPELRVVVDLPDNATALAAAAAHAGLTLDVLVDVDLGRHRTGAATPADTLSLAGQIAASPHLRYRGVQAYAGHIQHVYGWTERQQAHLVTHECLSEHCRALRQAGLPPEVVTGGGTGSFLIDTERKLFNELQPGSYLFMDVDYNKVDAPASAPRFETSLFVLSSVVSANHAGLATIDAGIKCLATDGLPPQPAGDLPAGTVYTFAGDEHGILKLGDPAARLKVGDHVRCITSHCDPTVNLHDRYHCYRGDRLVEMWPIDGRGKSL